MQEGVFAPSHEIEFGQAGQSLVELAYEVVQHALQLCPVRLVLLLQVAYEIKMYMRVGGGGSRTSPPAYSSTCGFLRGVLGLCALSRMAPRP